MALDKLYCLSADLRENQKLVENHIVATNVMMGCIEDITNNLANINLLSISIAENISQMEYVGMHTLETEKYSRYADLVKDKLTDLLGYSPLDIATQATKNAEDFYKFASDYIELDKGDNKQ